MIGNRYFDSWKEGEGFRAKIVEVTKVTEDDCETKDVATAWFATIEEVDAWHESNQMVPHIEDMGDDYCILYPEE